MTSTAHTEHDPSLLVVETAQGRVRGDHSRGAYRYKGIPFAAPPVGALRFAPPAPPARWSGDRVATGRFSIAPQPLGGVDALLGAEGGPPQSEADCLTLNVWTPAPDGARRPVMVWIHGGAFISGAGLTPFYDGANLAGRDVVVVSLNYRLGALGFLHLADLGGEAFAESANVGLLDQAMALRWVHENIEAFGGDPANVTIFGESAGAMSVGSHLALPASAGLFHRAIAQSGAASQVHDRDQATEVAAALLRELDLAESDVERLREIPLETLLAAQATLSARRGISAGLPFRPTTDGVSLPVAPLAAVRAGSAAGIAVLTGTNRDEMKLFTAMDPGFAAADEEVLLRRTSKLVSHDPEGLVATYRAALPGASAKDLFEAIATDAVFRIPALDLAEAQSAHAPTWLYEFHEASTAFGGMLGSAHAVEIPYVFDNLDAPGASFLTGEVTEQMRALARDLADAWTSFARSGDPNGSDLPAWAAYDTTARMTLVTAAAESQVAADPAGPFREAWQQRR